MKKVPSPRNQRKLKRFLFSDKFQETNLVSVCEKCACDRFANPLSSSSYYGCLCCHGYLANTVTKVTIWSNF